MAFSLLYSRLLLVFLLVLTSWAAGAQQLDSVFLDAPRETIDLEKANEPQFQLFDEAFYQNQLFFLGESHGVQRLQLLDFALLRHLNQRAGVRYYLAEVDCAKAYYLNDYLRTGDEETLGRVFVSWVRTQAQWGNADFVEKIRRIRHLNLTLPAARRIRFVGIDGLQDAALMADYLAALRTTGRPLSPVLTSCLDSVQGALRHTPAAAGAVALRAQQRLQAAEPASRRALGSAYAHVQYVLTNVGYARTLPSREAQLFANYQAALPLWHLADEKLYGLWGLGHVLQRPAQGNYVALAARIRQSTLPGHDKMVSILSSYSGSQMMMPSTSLPLAWRTPNQAFTGTDKYNHDGPLVWLHGLAPLLATTRPGTTTLFRLDAPGTAAQRLPVQMRYAPGVPPGQQLQLDPQLPAAAYVQYLLLVRNSGMTTPLVP